MMSLTMTWATNKRSMAGDGHRKDTMAMDIVQILVIFNVFTYLTTYTDAVESHGQAFVQTDKELRYMVDKPLHDGVSLHQGIQNFPDISADSFTSIRFEPLFLDFGKVPVGMPSIKQVTVQNLDTERSIHLLSIAGSTLHFHCSFFQDKMVPPGGNTTFDVVFLARMEGNVENTLYIHTSHGQLKYQVFGVGISNPYRIHPFLGAKIPVNSSFSPLIHLHNPHNTKLQVVEMYSSGGDLHLELPTGEREAPKNLWEIPPYETKPVMRANFVGRIEKNHTTFIRIKTNKERKDKNQLLVLPVEVEVSSEPGIYSHLERLDFGILRTLDFSKTLKLNLLNNGNKPVQITSVSVHPANAAISIEFRPVKIQSDVLQPTTVALITYTASKALQPKDWSGKIVVKSKGGTHKLSIPYQANVLHGSLVYEVNTTKFYVGKPPFENVTRDLKVTNTFNFTIVIYNISISQGQHSYFSVVNFSEPVHIQPQQTLSLCQLQFRPNVTHLHLTALLQLFTNASMFHIPLIVYNGLLKVVHHRPEIYKGQLDFGTIRVEEKRSLTFTLRNENPVDIVISEFSSSMQQTVIEVLGVEKGNGTMLTRTHNLSQIETNPLVIKPYHYAVFSVNLVAPNYEGAFAAEIHMTTQFENMFIPMTITTAEGSINAIPEQIVFEEVYPGKIPHKVLRIHSTFDNYLYIDRVAFQPNDSRFTYEPPKDLTGPPVLEPGDTATVGRIYFNAKKECKEDCYVGLPTYTPAGHQWLLGLALEKDVADTDQYLYTRFRQRWQLLSREMSTVNVTIQLDTNEVRGFLFPAQAHFHWPILIRQCQSKFPLTQIGNLSISDFIVENPGDVPILIQILTLSQYPNPHTIVDLMGAKLSAENLTDYIEADDLDIFTLRDLEIYTKKPKSAVANFRKHIETTLGVKPHKRTITTMLNPGVGIKVRVGFQPKDDLHKTSLIIIRNNLTILDTVVVQGRGGRGELRFSNRKPGSQTPLTFEMTEKHLKNCDKKKQSKSIPPNFTVKRTFTARNTGQLPFFIHGFGINNEHCEGYGFRVLDCHGFELQPNASRKVDIAFTPDFTMSRIRRTLAVHTSLGINYTYTLQSTIPAHMLTKCASALPRPPWEPILYYSIICIMGFLLFCILVASFFEADRIFMADISKRRIKVSSATQTFDKGKVFDLKNIAGVKGTPNEKLESNGQIFAKPKKDPPTSVVSPIRTTPQRQNPQENSRTSSEKQALRDRDTRSGSLNGNSKQGHTDKSYSTTDDYTSKTGKKNKAASKRPDDLSNVEYGSAQEKKQSIKELVFGSRKADAQNKVNYEREKHVVSGIPRKSERNGLFHQYEPIEGPGHDDLEEVTLYSGKNQGKLKVKRKSKLKVEKERNSKHKETNDNDKDETSSTTTESSSADAEDKVSSARDSTPEPQRPKKKSKNKSKEKKTREEEEDINDDDFVVSSNKCKGHKKIKVDPKCTYGGDILRPNTLELPYKLQSEDQMEKEEPASPHALAADIAAKVLKKAPKIKLPKLRGGEPLPLVEPPSSVVGSSELSRSKLPATTSSFSSSSSSSPQWDLPYKPLPISEDDLSLLAHQTELFALRNRHLNNVTTSPDPLSSSSRSSSYSSIVSSSSNNGGATAGNDLNRPPKINKGSAFTPITDFRTPPPPLGNKNMVSIKPNMASGMKVKASPWPITATSPAGGDISSYSLQPIAETQHPGMIHDEEMINNYGNNNNNVGGGGAAPDSQFGLQDIAANGTNQFGFMGANFDQPATMMQRLLADRRKRLMEYQQKVLKGEDWPGFNITLNNESLWDNSATMPSATAWSTVTDSPPRQTAAEVSSLWSPPPASTSATWTSMSESIWSTTPSTMTSSADSSLLDTSPPPPISPTLVVGDRAPETPSDQAPVGNFDPFNTLGNIWKPAGGPSASAWSFNSEKPDEDDN